ncbi:hypothetical protein D3C71_1270410 [compost metagenome]
MVADPRVPRPASVAPEATRKDPPKRALSVSVSPPADTVAAPVYALLSEASVSTPAPVLLNAPPPDTTPCQAKSFGRSSAPPAAPSISLRPVPW